MSVSGFSPEEIAAELSGRTLPEQITMSKHIGIGSEDVAAVLEKLLPKVG